MKYADWTDARNTSDSDVLVCRVLDNDGRKTWNPSRDRVVAEAAFTHADAVSLIRSGGDVDATMRAATR